MKTAQLANQPRINFSAGKNIRGEVVGSILTLTIDLHRSIGPSKSGRNTLVATTAGNFVLPDGVTKVGINVYRSIEAIEQP